ncbi:MAG: Hsp20/alpha crystallin family protein [Thermodesulfobacteriota bacterium]|nr:Hsp20/alpha crystallin family protein [Thermodesulfobacteriota bacterium]
MVKKHAVFCALLVLLVATTPWCYAQDGAFGFSNPWGNGAIGSGDLFSGSGMDQSKGVDTLSRLMDFDGTVSHSLDPDDFFDRFLDPPVAEDQEKKSLLAPFGISETEKEMAFKAGLLPGTGLGDVAVSSDGEVLTVNVEKTAMDEESGDHYSQGEWSRESFTRITPLPAEVKKEAFVTSYEDGVLTVTFPKNQ